MNQTQVLSLTKYVSNRWQSVLITLVRSDIRICAGTFFESTVVCSTYFLELESGGEEERKEEAFFHAREAREGKKEGHILLKE